MARAGALTFDSHSGTVDVALPPSAAADVDVATIGGDIANLITPARPVQSRDLQGVDSRSWKVVTRRAPTADEIEALQFAWLVVKHVKSNAIVLAQRDVTVGIGMGQTNRVDSVRIAAERAGGKARGAALGSDAFFPFADGVEAAVEAGVACIAQPGGSVRDQEVIAAADRHGIAMVFTGFRHFRH